MLCISAMFVVYRNNGSTLFSDPLEAVMTMFLMSLQDFTTAYESFDTVIKLSWMPKVPAYTPNYIVRHS